MKFSKKDIFFLYLSFAVIALTLILVFSREPNPLSENPTGFSLIDIFSGRAGILIIYIAAIGFFGSTAVLVLFAISTMSITSIFVFTDGMNIWKRVAFSYFISMYLVVILAYLISIR